MMNGILRPMPILLHGTIAAAVLFAIFVGVNIYQEATAQTENATSATNQTSQSLGNLTRGDFSPVQENLAVARDNIFERDGNLRAYFALNAADDALYGVVDRLQLEPEVGDLLRQQIVPVRQSINDAQEAVFDGDFAKALKDLDSADTTLVKITLPLPSSETGEE